MPKFDIPKEDWPKSNHHVHGNPEDGSGCGLPIHLCTCEDYAEEREQVIQMLEEHDAELDLAESTAPGIHESETERLIKLYEELVQCQKQWKMHHSGDMETGGLVVYERIIKKVKKLVDGMI